MKSEKLMAKISEKTKKLKGEDKVELSSTSNQYEQINFLTKKKSLKVYPTYKDYCSTPSYDSKYPTPAAITNVVIKNGKIVSFDLQDYKIFYGLRTYKPSGAGIDSDGNVLNVTCWRAISGNPPYIIAYNSTLYVIDNDPFYSNECCIEGVYGKKGASPEELLSYITPFIESRKLQQEKLNNEAQAGRDAEHEKYTIANKEVSKIEIAVNHDDKMGIWSEFTFSITATLKDGSTLKTSDKGYLNDYNISVIGAETELLSAYTVQPQVTKLKGDYILIEVSAKHDETIKTEKKIVLNYKNSVKLYYEGSSGISGPSAKPEQSLRIEAKTIKHSETGESLVQYNVYNLDGDLINSVRVLPNRSFYVSTKGGNGSSNSSDSWNNGNGYDGESGGSITFIKDTNLKDYTFDYDTNGGTGGNGVNSYYSNGRHGTDGSVTTKVQSVNW